jgi:glutaredoxin 3
MSNAKAKAQKIIDENNVVVFSKSYCPYCRATKSLLDEKHAKYFSMELDQVGEFLLALLVKSCDGLD